MIEHFYGIAVEEETESMFVLQYNSSYGGIILTLMHGDTDTVENSLISTSAGSGGTAFLTADSFPDRPFLYSDDLVVLISDSSLYVFDRKTGAVKKSINFSGLILDAVWLDRKEEIFAFLGK